MRIISKIASQLLVVVTVLTFAISTTGFTFYTYECSHCDTRPIEISVDQCCSEVVKEVPAESHGCCDTSDTPKTRSGCNSDVRESNCCETELNYYRLSEWFLESNEEQLENECFANELEIQACEQDEVNDHCLAIQQLSPVLKKPKQPLYRLFHRVKINPPLI